MKRSEFYLVEKSARVLTDGRQSAASVTRNVYRKEHSGLYFVRYKGEYRGVYLSKTYDANYGWFLCR